MSDCDVCGSQLIEVLPGLLMRCPICRNYKRVRGLEPVQVEVVGAAPGGGVAATSYTHSVESGGGSAPVGDDMDIFIDRVCARLIPIHADYTASVKKKLEAARKRYRKQLLAVFNGKMTLEDWTNKTRNELGLHPIALGKILYQSLSGLRSQDAKEMRLAFADYLQRLGMMYQIR